LADEEATILFISHPQWHKCVGIIREQDEITAFPKIGLSLPCFDFLAVEGMPGIVHFYRGRIRGSMRCASRSRMLGKRGSRRSDIRYVQKGLGGQHKVGYNLD
jgi:hypothetical protein